MMRATALRAAHDPALLYTNAAFTVDRNDGFLAVRASAGRRIS
jgi:hypothetical protein